MDLVSDLKSEILKDFSGKNREQMPKLLDEKRIPLSISRGMQLMLAGCDIGSYDSGDAYAIHPDGRVKIDLDLEFLRGLNPESKRSLTKVPRRYGGFDLTDAQFDEIDGIELGYLGAEDSSLSERDVLNHGTLRSLARSDELLADWFNYVSLKTRELNTRENIKFQPFLTKIHLPQIRGFSMDSIWTGPSIRGTLNYKDGRLIGEAPRKDPVRVERKGRGREYVLDEQLRFLNVVNE
jgi:hypothetical protein|tara:strand:+ start:525 stop:1235 length:711 start_codon:yes stop_codon:yes gene_type:complete